ncbi:hypothetical protein LZG04_21285 [Saccharothrix sp. S26]|uniref:hypothetical protein n=1 Tax=Saccharothrix sp. S26 TaxID=2907215 RepID=UPI001F4252A2|nr:hypothetical protein [Saccharothrix sp. S26]MCE6997317.1 hypothetical protein [Saccharothrix sp. S26]
MKSTLAVSILVAPVLVACTASPAPTTASQPGPTSAVSVDLLEGRHEVGTLTGPKPRQSSWLADDSYAFHWDFADGPRVDYLFSLSPAAGTTEVKSTVWLSKSCGEVDFSVQPQGNAIRHELTEFATDPQYTYEVRAELTFVVDGARPDARESFSLTAVAEKPSSCGLYWGMFFPSRR